MSKALLSLREALTLVNKHADEPRSYSATMRKVWSGEVSTELRNGRHHVADVPRFARQLNVALPAEAEAAE